MICIVEVQKLLTFFFFLMQAIGFSLVKNLVQGFLDFYISHC